MEHVAIDLGGRKSQICVRDAQGGIVEEIRVDTRMLGRYLAERPPCRVIVETCSEAFHVAEQARSAGHDVRVVPATLVRTLGVGARKTKTDRRDARVLSEVSSRIELPSVHIPSQQSRRYKQLCGSREVLIAARTQQVNHVRGWLRGVGIQVRRGAVSTFARRVQDAVGEAGQTIPEPLTRVLTAIEVLTALINEAHSDVKQAAKQDPVCRRLMSVPGVGPVTAVRYTASLDDVSRFPNAHSVESYLGLVPGEHSSSDHRHRLSVTKAGSAAVRRVLVQAAWVAWRIRPGDPLVHWAERIAARRGKFIAVVALARKLAGILFALWRDQSLYDPRRAARPDPDVGTGATP